MGRGGTRAEKVNAYKVLIGDSCCGLSVTVFLMWVLRYVVGDIGVMGAVHVSDHLLICEGFVTSSVMFELKLSKCQVSANSVSI